MAVKLTPSTSLFRNTDTSGPQPWLTLGTELDAPADPPPIAPAPLRLTTFAAVVTPAAPVVDLNGAAAGTSATLAYTENQSLTPIAPGATVTDADSANFDTGALTVAFTANGTADDQLQIKDGGNGVGQISVSETDVYYNFGHVDANNLPVGPELIGSYSGGADGFTPLTVTLNANATPTATQALVEAIGYFNISDAPSTAPRTVTYTLTDESGHASNPVTATINVTAVADPPVVNGDTFGTDENVPLTGNLFADNGSGNDYSPDGTPLQITAVNGNAAAVGQQIVLPSGATLTVNADGSFTYNPNGAFNSLVPSSSGASNTFGTDSFTYSTTGGGGATARVFVNGVESPGDIYMGSSGNDTITGSANNDFFMVQQGVAPFPASHDTVNGLGGNDTFYFGGALISADVVDGGAGIDQIAIQGNYTAGNALTLGTGVVNVESLAILPGSDTRFGDPGTNSYSYDVTTLDVNVAAGAQLVVDANRLRVGEDFTFNGAAETDGSFFIYGGMGTDHLTGGAKNDVFYFGENLQFGASDTVNGGPGGTDQLALRGDYSGANAITFGAGQLTSIENIGMVSAHDTRFGPLGSHYNYDLTMNDGNVAAGQRMTVDAALLRSDETLHFNGSAELDGSFRVFGGAGDDVITGSHGNDILSGGLGADTLTGGAGNDTFLYRNVAESTPAGRDGIQDFSTGDIIDLSQIDGDTTLAGKQSFHFVNGGAFTSHAGELIAVNTAGPIWTVSGDVNGDGVADFQVVVTTDHVLTAADFHL